MLINTLLREYILALFRKAIVESIVSSVSNSGVVTVPDMKDVERNFAWKRELVTPLMWGAMPELRVDNLRFYTAVIYSITSLLLMACSEGAD